MSPKTIDFYNKNYLQLIKKYDSAKMYSLHSIFKKYIKKSSSILDIGFGSGRDLYYLQSISKNIYGLDASEKFVKSLKSNSFFKNRVSVSTLPDINTLPFKIETFNTIILIAILMHLDKNEIKKSILNIKKKCEIGSKVIISYSTESRVNDERDFFPISQEEMTLMFEAENFKEVESLVNTDSLKREIKWVTQIYEL